MTGPISAQRSSSSSDRPLLDRRYVSAIFDSDSLEEKTPSLRSLPPSCHDDRSHLGVAFVPGRTCLSNMLNIDAPTQSVSFSLDHRIAAAK